MTFRPMLAATLTDLKDAKFPCLVSPKLDGIRCVIKNGAALTRTLKPIPNRHIRSLLSHLPEFDGEIIVGPPTASDVWNVTSSAVMSHDGEPDFTYWVFDECASQRTFEDRLRWTAVRAGMYGPMVKFVPHHLCFDVADLAKWEEAFVDLGYEGLMLRDPQGLYKHGRSTLKESGLLKLKRFDDLEARVHGVKERLRNVAESLINERGYREKDHKKDHMVGAGDLGAFICQIEGSSGTECIEFDVGSGFSDGQRVNFWEWAKTGTAYDPIGKVIKVKHQGFTPDGKPRFPVFLGFRDERDIV